MRAILRRSMRIVLVTAGVGLLVSGAPPTVRGQQADDPFGAAPDEPAMEDAPADAPAEAPADEPFGAVADPFGADAAAPADEPAPPAPRERAAPGAKPEGEAAPAAPTDPAVLAILESKPKTPAELLRAIEILVDLDEAARAKPFADELGQRTLDPAAKTALVDAFNPAKLLKLARHPELGVVLGPLVDDWLRSAEEYRRDAARLDAATEQLSDPNEAKRAEAAVTLLRAREAAVRPLVRVLGDPEQAARQPAARQMLLYLGDLAIEPLLGVLESPDAALKTQVIEVLGQIGAHQAVPQLLAPLIASSSPPEMRAAASAALARIMGQAPQPAEALRMLEEAARQPLEASRNNDPETAAPAVVWHWNRQKNESMPVEYDQTGAALARATRLARDLYLIDPDRVDWRRQYLTAMLQAAKLRAGLGHPLSTGQGTAYSVAAYYGVDVLDDLLAQAMADGYLPAATAAAQVLGDIGSPVLLTRSGTTPSPLAQAAGHSDRRLRFAAIEAIMKLNPSEPFAGSSHVADGLGFMARSVGVPRVLVVHPSSAEAQKMAGLAAMLGYEADTATNGRAAFELAAKSPDYDFVLIHSAIQSPQVDYLVAQLRRDRRTALLPIGLVAPVYDLDRIARFAERTPIAEVFLQPVDEAEMKVRASQLLTRGGRWHVPATERKAEGVAALDWLGALAASPQRVFDIYRQEPALEAALYLPDVSTRAAAVLAKLGTATAQRSLLELADLATQPAAAREAAAAALARNIETFGLRLTRDQILQQYDLYNANGGRNGDTHVVLSTVLDAIEQKNTPTGGQ